MEWFIHIVDRRVGNRLLGSCFDSGSVLAGLGRRRGCKDGGDTDQQAGGGEQADDRKSFHLHNSTNPFFGKIVFKAVVQGRKSAFLLLQVDQGHRIDRALFQSHAGKDRLVTAQLDVAVGKQVHDPDQQIEPVQAKGSGQQQLEQTVEAADVDILVGQDAVERFLRQRKVLTRQQDDRMQDAIGQRAGNAVVLSDGDGSAQRVAGKPMF